MSLPRTFLYAPPLDDRSVRAALASTADVVVLDLEDLTPTAEKDAAAKAAGEVLHAPAKPVLVRINHPSAGRLRADLEAVVTPALHTVRIPKVESPEQVRAVAAVVEELRVERGIVRTIPLQVMVETAVGVEAAHALAVATHTVSSIGLGEGDLRKDLGVTSDEGLQYFRSRIVGAARAAGLPGPVQVTFPARGPIEELRRTTELGRSLGFGARNIANPEHAEMVHLILGSRTTRTDQS